MSNSKSNTATVSNTAKSNTTASNTAVAGDKKIKGNKATKIYHLPGCPDYDSVSAANVVTFDTEQEARKAGYKIAGNCK
jgi:methylphosphotriester-DNA--protein-cysteine methyltransferase